MYTLEVFFKDNYEIDKIDFSVLDNFLEEKTTILNKEFIFDNNVNLEQYNPLKLNCYIVYHLDNMDESIKKLIERVDFVKYVKVNVISQKQEEIKSVEIEISKIDKLIKNIDGMFFLRKKLFDFLPNVAESKQEEYTNILKKLSLLKYDLKREAFELRIVDIEKEIASIKKVIKDYITILGINIELKFSYNDVHIDKTMFSRLKVYMLDLLLNSVLEYFDEKNKNVCLSDDYLIEVNIKQEGYWLYLTINNKGRSLLINEIYENAKIAKILNKDKKYTEKDILSSMLKKDYVNAISELDEKEKVMVFVKANNIITELNGEMELVNQKDEYIKYMAKIPLNIVYLEGLIFTENKRSYIIDTNTIVEKIPFDISKVVKIDGTNYYNYKDINYLYVDLGLEKDKSKDRLALIIKVNNTYLITDVDSKVYLESVYFDRLSEDEVYLKSIKRAKIIDMALYI